MMVAHAVGRPLAPAPPDAPRTLVEALRQAALTRRGITFVRAGAATTVSYAELLDAAREQLGALQSLGLRKGDAVVMQLPELRVHVTLLWAAILGGIAPVNIAIPPRYDPKSGVVQKLLGVVEDLDARHVLAWHSNDEALRTLLAPVAPKCVVHDASALVTAQPAIEPPIATEDTCFYQLTSGSTGKSKVSPPQPNGHDPSPCTP